MAAGEVRHLQVRPAKSRWPPQLEGAAVAVTVASGRSISAALPRGDTNLNKNIMQSNAIEQANPTFVGRISTCRQGINVIKQKNALF